MSIGKRIEGKLKASRVQCLPYFMFFSIEVLYWYLEEYSLYRLQAISQIKSLSFERKMTDYHLEGKGEDEGCFKWG
jgi:hypothetical protein